MIKAITVCVNYDDILDVTIDRMVSNVDQLVVVTSTSDKKTKLLCKNKEKVKLLQTDSFYSKGAKFRKGLAIEEGFDFIGRNGWILVIDADILLPEKMPLPAVEVGKIYSPYRRVLPRLEDAKDYMDVSSWGRLDKFNDQEFAGYFQLFNGSDPVLRKKPWYGIDWMHAGGCDSVFERKWMQTNKVRPNFDVLHIGPIGVNWHGRITGRVES